MINAKTIMQRNEVLYTAEIDNELVMMDPEAGFYYSLNIVGKKIWELLAEPISLENLVEKLIILFEINILTCKIETEVFLEILLRKKIIFITN